MQRPQGAGSGGHHRGSFSPREANHTGGSQAQAWTFGQDPEIREQKRLDGQGGMPADWEGSGQALRSADSGGSTRASPCGREGAPHGSGQAARRTGGLRAGSRRAAGGRAAPGSRCGGCGGRGGRCRWAGPGLPERREPVSDARWRGTPALRARACGARRGPRVGRGGGVGGDGGAGRGRASGRAGARRADPGQGVRG